MSRYNAKIIENYQLAEDFYKMTIDAKKIAQWAYPGQFIHIKIPGDNSLLLRRPISINGIDVKTGQLDIVYQVVGKGTKALSKLKEGIGLDILGPLGKGFHIPEGTKKLYILGGGCGVAPMRFVGQRWRHLDIYSFLGFRSQSTVFQLNDFECFSRKVFLSTDDGTMGYKGSIVSLLNERLSIEKTDLLLACGPIPMIKALQKVVSEHDIPCQISLEERMGCGVGGCVVCSCVIGNRKQWDYKKVCTDGPVFWSQEVILDGES